MKKPASTGSSIASRLNLLLILNIVLHCGQDVPTPNVFYSTSNQMYVRMKADGSVTSKGFLGNFTRACGATIHTSGEGDLSSPNYPHAWENGGDCTWTIIGDSLSKMKVFLYIMKRKIIISEYFC